MLGLKATHGCQLSWCAGPRETHCPLCCRFGVGEGALNAGGVLWAEAGLPPPSWAQDARTLSVSGPRFPSRPQTSGLLQVCALAGRPPQGPTSEGSKMWGAACIPIFQHCLLLLAVL